MSEAQSPWRRAFPWLVLLAASLLAFSPALHGTLVWDDDAHLTKAGLRSWSGLGQIWFRLGATQQYYPVLHTAFWVEHRLWGDDVVGYHLVTLLWHVTAAGLFAQVLLSLFRLRASGGGPGLSASAAWGAALLFAVHPVGVESVAWISEQKNTLSLVWYLVSALAYLRFDRSRSGRDYGIALVLFGLALLTKSVTATLPCALALALWWVRGHLRWKRDLCPLLPWVALGVAAGLFTAWVERTYIGASGSEFALGPLSRLLLAGHIAVFYLGKLLWPSGLVFIYPRWTVDPREVLGYGYLAVVLGATAGLWYWRSSVRGLFACWLFFLGSLTPALGFVNVYPFIFSYVADHFQYLASLGFYAALAGGVTYLYVRSSRLGRPLLGAAGLAVVVCLVGLSRIQARTYRDAKTLYQVTLEQNPQAWLAHLNLGNILLEEGRVDEAVAHYRAAEGLAPRYPSTHFNLGLVLLGEGRPAEAATEFQRTVDLNPRDEVAMSDLGVAFGQMGRLDDAEHYLAAALALDPRDAKSHGNLGSVYAGQSKLPAAVAEYRAALAIDASLAQVEQNLGIALQRLGDEAEAQRHFAAAARLVGQSR